MSEAIFSAAGTGGADHTVCPCGGLPSGAAFRQCCAPFVSDGEPAPTAEQLMRSRYTAFALRRPEHLWRTWHPRTRTGGADDLAQGLNQMTWCGLVILSTTEGQVEDSAGTVDFVATFTSGDGARHQVREHSRFAKRAGRWFYLDGDELPLMH